MTIFFGGQSAWHGLFRRISPHLASKFASMPPAVARAARACCGYLRGKRSGCICESGQIGPFRPPAFRFIPIFPAARVMLSSQLETRVMAAPRDSLRVLRIQRPRMASKSLSMNDYCFYFLNFLICLPIGFLGSMAGRSSCASTFRTCIR